MNINKVIFAGKLTASPELKNTPSGMAVVNFSLASNRKFKTSSGEVREEVEFGRCVVFGKSAEAFKQYAVKGQTFLVEGRMKTSSWDKPDGSKAYKTEIFVDNFQFGQKPLNATTSSAPEPAPDYSSGEVDDPFHDFKMDSVPDLEF